MKIGKKNKQSEVQRNRHTNLSEEQKPQASFRRGQTISGYKKEDSERQKRHDLVVQRRKLSSFFMFIAGLAVFVIFIMSQLIVRVDVSLMNGEKIDDQRRYSDIAQKYLEDHPVERLRIFLNGDNLLAEMKKELPEISKISKISFAGFTNVDISLDMRKPVAAWQVSADKTYFVDNSGIAFSKNFFEAPSVLVSDESGIQLADGKIAVSNSFLSFIGQIIGKAQENGIVVEKIVIPPASLREVEVYVKDLSFPFKLITSRPAGEQVESLKTTLNYLNNRGISPKYVDLRVSGKAYFQ